MPAFLPFYYFTSLLLKERVTGIEPAPAHWRYAESRSEVLRAAITLHPQPVIVQRYEKLFIQQKKGQNIWNYHK